MEGRQIEDQTDLARAMNTHRAGDTITVTVYRGKRKLDIKVTLDEARTNQQGRTAA
jgi:S1-C subfamily serine protease